MTKIKVGSDFSGVGAFDQALIRLGIDYETLFACDMDKYARQTFVLNYGEPKYYPKDVYEREIPKESLDIYMTSPPCQAFSLAGKRKGEDDKRGVLFYNSHEFIVKNNPRYFIFENVKGLLSDDNGKTFQRWIDFLGGKSVNGNPVIFPHEESVPYHVYYQVLNAKHYGIPQNRERIFIIGIRDDEDNSFSFPKPIHLTKRLKDVLETEVYEKYFLSKDLIDFFITNTNTNKEKGNGFAFKPKKDEEIGNSITTKSGSRMDDNFIKIGKWNDFKDSDGNKKGFQELEDGICPTILARAREDGSGMNVVKISTNNSKGFDVLTEEDSLNYSNSNSKTRRGRVGKGVAQTLDTNCQQGVIVSDKMEYDFVADYRADEGLMIREDDASPCITSSIRHSDEWQPKAGTRNAPLVGFKHIDNDDVKPYQIGQSDQTFAAKNGTLLGKENQEAFCIRASQPNGVYSKQRIRRLTPLECFRLMDFNENFYTTINFNNIINSQGIVLSLQNKKDIKWNVKELDVIEKQKLKECVCSIIKDGTNTVMKILSSNTHTERTQNAQLKVVVEMFTAKDIVQNTTILTENGVILYLAKNNNLKSLKKQGNELLILEEKSVSEEKENLYTDYYLKLSLEESLKGVSASTILTMIQTITNCLTCIYSIPKENTISVILNYKNCQKNFLKGELLSLKMGGIILSDSQLYKQAGNSICVGVLVEIIKKLKL